jgi:hypothetical protein
MRLSEIDCWDGYKKQGTKKGTGKNKGKRVNNCVPEEVSSDTCSCNCGKEVCESCGKSHKKKVKEQQIDEITLEDTQDFEEEFGVLGYSIDENDLFEAEYQGRKVKLNKPMQGDTKKFKVYVKNPKGNVVKVNFGHGGTSVKGKAMRIRKNNPKARKSFRARHNCDNPGPKTKARYWSCRKW